jgi:hypothetical protein
MPVQFAGLICLLNMPGKYAGYICWLKKMPAKYAG